MRTLLATTALVALAGGTASAEVTIGGDARFNLKYDSSAADSMSIHQRFRATFAASGATDAGLNFGGSAIINSDSGGVGDGVVSISGAFGTLEFGAKDSADVLAGGIADVGMQGIGVDDVAEKGLRGATDPGNVALYTHTLGTINLAVSGSVGVTDADDPTASTSDEFAIGMNIAAGDVTVGIGYDSMETTSFGGSWSFDQITTSFYYAERGTTDGVGIDASYALGPTTLTMVAAQNSSNDEGMGLGVSHDLGGGATLIGGFGRVSSAGAQDATGAEVGLSFKF